MPLINSTAIPELELKDFGRNLLAAKIWSYINTITFEKVQYKNITVTSKSVNSLMNTISVTFYYCPMPYYA